ncbi:hypothetical protein [Paraburkholderia sp. J12]|uniref:hypothetical protein n=1 Tax=Paraburkholderia sp. J12 TaxID=2805432 RepID=UPI002ABE4B5D|nr:hypothetical protein [Paraburkholderia sp. J12]
MSTISFVQVEGSLALPRMRPLDRIPAPFGREWALLPPHFSLRAELKALYAAILRTVCLNAKTFASACRWDPHRSTLAEPAAAPVDVAGDVGPPAAAAQAPDGTFTAAARPQTNTSPATAPKHSESPPPFTSNKFAGSAVAIGGAALLTWIVASHLPNEGKQATPASIARANLAADRTATQGTPAEHTEHGLATITENEVRPGDRLVQAPPVPAQEHAAPAAPNRPDYSETKESKTVQVVALPPSPAAAAPENRTGSSSTTARKPASHSQTSREARMIAPGHSAHTVAAHGGESRNVTNRVTGTYAQAGHYSPRAPSVNPDDDYASITTYANTYSAPRAAGRPAIPVDSTDWVNHVSQRRVTEIPDRFEK